MYYAMDLKLWHNEFFLGNRNLHSSTFLHGHFLPLQYIFEDFKVKKKEEIWSCKKSKIKKGTKLMQFYKNFEPNV